MRRALILAALVAALARPAVAAPAARDSVALLAAPTVALFVERGVLLADGGASFHYGNVAIDATRIEYDLRANVIYASIGVRVGGLPLGQGGYAFDFNTAQGSARPSLALPTYPSSDASVTATQAQIVPGKAIAFSNANLRSGSLFAPVPAYTYAIPPPASKNFGYSPVPSAALEWPFVLAYHRDGFVFSRLRYDRYNGGPGTGLEEHYARTDRGYVAFGQTLDRDAGRLDLAAYERMNDQLSQTFTASTLPGSRVFRYSLAATGTRGYANLSFSQYDATRSDDLLLSSSQRAVGRAGSLRLQFDLGHDVHPFDAAASQDWRMTPAFHYDAPALHLGRTTLSASTDVGESLYDYGRATLSTAANVWASHPVNARLFFNGGIAFSHNAPPYPFTSRAYTIGSSWKASDAFDLASSLVYAHDDNEAPGYGRPEFSLAFDTRFRRRNGTHWEVATIVPFGRYGNFSRQAAFNVRYLK